MLSRGPVAFSTGSVVTAVGAAMLLEMMWDITAELRQRHFTSPLVRSENKAVSANKNEWNSKILIQHFALIRNTIHTSQLVLYCFNTNIQVNLYFLRMLTKSLDVHDVYTGEVQALSRQIRQQKLVVFD